MASQRRTQCAVVGRPGVGTERQFRCLDTAEAGRLAGLGEAVVVRGYNSEEECGAGCSALTAMPPEMGAEVAAYVPLSELGALERTTRGTRQAVLVERERERRACDDLRRRYPSLWAWLTEDGNGEAPAPTRALELCAQWDLACTRPCAEALRRALDWELAVPFGALTAGPQGWEPDPEGGEQNIPFRVYEASARALLASSVTAARMRTRPAPIRDLLPATRELPVAFEGDTLRIMGAPGGDRTFLYAQALGSAVELTTADSGWIRLRLELESAGTAADDNDFALLILDVPPPPTISLEALRGDLGDEVQLGAMETNARAFEALVGLEEGAIELDPERLRYEFDAYFVNAIRLQQFFTEAGYPFDYMEAPLFNLG